MPRSDNSRCSRRPNALAVCISLMAIGILYAANNPETAANSGDLIGPNTAAIGLTLTSTLKSPDANPESGGDTDESSEAAASDGPQVSLSGRMALLMHVLMLEKARDRVASFSGYSVNFHKHERIDGSMQKPQTIAMEVRHSPFSVYMKWRTGDRGRQLLYKPEAQDGYAMVKLGGLKGRLLPAIRIKPDGSKAMAESRYPITKAGILPLIDTMLDYRRDDLKRSGVQCDMLEHQDYNGTDCFCFVIRYPSAQVSKLYRTSIAYLDSESLIPLRIRNYTWAADSEGLLPEELDEQTLIEDYAFSDLQVKPDQICAEVFRNKKL